MRDKRKKPFYIERGDVYMADLGSEDEVVGSEQSGVRPIVVTQCNRQNEKSPTIIIDPDEPDQKRADGSACDPAKGQRALEIVHGVRRAAEDDRQKQVDPLLLHT